VAYVVGRLSRREPLVAYLYAPFADSEQVQGQWLTLLLDTGDRMEGYGQRVDSSSWLLLHPVAEP
jgi:hypothetical protein